MSWAELATREEVIGLNRNMNIAYISLGGNLNSPIDTFHLALKQIEEFASICAVSPLYQTHALTLPGTPAQADYVNGVAAIKTPLSAQELLAKLLKIETGLGRDRTSGERWAPRTIDIDILLFNNETISSSTLKIPHPELPNRDFVLKPLSDIAPNLLHPTLERSIHELLLSLQRRGEKCFIFAQLSESLEIVPK